MLVKLPGSWLASIYNMRSISEEELRFNYQFCLWNNQNELCLDSLHDKDAMDYGVHRWHCDVQWEQVEASLEWWRYALREGEWKPAEGRQNVCEWEPGWSGWKQMSEVIRDRRIASRAKKKVYKMVLRMVCSGSELKIIRFSL